MGGLPDDIVQFVERRFAQTNREPVYRALETAAVSTPRVMRAVLYLSSGSLSLLERYVGECNEDVRGILTSAEYEADVHGEAMHVRDMSLPFTDERNLGKGGFKKNLVVVGQQGASGSPSDPEMQPANHAYLVQRSFKLGQATYLVARGQPDPDRVYCYRKNGTVARLVKLPLSFVLEQLAECIELDATTQ